MRILVREFAISYELIIQFYFFAFLSSVTCSHIFKFHGSSSFPAFMLVVVFVRTRVSAIIVFMRVSFYFVSLFLRNMQCTHRHLDYTIVLSSVFLMS